MTNLEINAAYIGSTEVTHMYLGDELVWGGEPGPVEDPMLRQPLTIEVTSVGTAATPQMGLSLSGVSGTSVARTSSAATYVDYTINDGALQTLALSGSISSRAITKAITGLSVGDVVRFYGPRQYNKNGLSKSKTVHVHFVYSADFQANVYGNVNSLLVTKSDFDNYAAGDDTVQFNASGYAYEYLFSGRTGFNFGTPSSEKHIVLPEPTNGIPDYGYASMFRGCTTLTVAPDLPATTLGQYCYYYMFYACTALTTPPAILPATSLTYSCYDTMFEECSSLASVPELPASTIATQSYRHMFTNCTGLTSVPKDLLAAATTLPDKAASSMFRNTRITEAPTLYATTIGNDCYGAMFRDNPALVVGPVICATTIGGNCFQNMFQNCTSLTQAPELPATTLADSCYYYMFFDCTSLTTAPELPATVLAQACYSNMFSNCTNLSYIKCLATDISAAGCTTNWVSGVAPSGTFIKNPNMSSWTTGIKGIPTNWTVQDAQ